MLYVSQGVMVGIMCFYNINLFLFIDIKAILVMNHYFSLPNISYKELSGVSKYQYVFMYDV